MPGLPGSWSQDATEREAVENIRDAIREYLSVVDEQLRGEDVRKVEIVVYRCSNCQESITSMQCGLLKKPVSVLGLALQVVFGNSG